MTAELGGSRMDGPLYRGAERTRIAGVTPLGRVAVLKKAREIAAEIEAQWWDKFRVMESGASAEPEALEWMLNAKNAKEFLGGLIALLESEAAL